MDEWSIRGAVGGNGGGGVADGSGTKTDGEQGKSHSNYKENKSTSKAGNGGPGGVGGARGGNGGLYALPAVGLTASPYRASDALPATGAPNFLEVDVTLDTGMKNGNGQAVKATYKQPFAGVLVPLDDVETGGMNPRAKRAGYRFAGYWTDDGTCVYGPDYKPTMVLWPYPKDMTLTARWEVAPEILSVTSSGDAASTLDVYGNTAITLRDAVSALAADPLLVGTDGRRRVTFEKLAEGDTTVRLQREIEVPTGVRSFEINGLYGLTNGVVIVAGSNARHFKFRGKATDEAAFSFANLTFKGGNVTDNGGSILVNGQASVSIDNCSFLGNHADNRGGAINVEASNAKITVLATTFAGNSSKYGGALRMTGNGAKALVVNTTFSGNTGSSYGGAANVVGCQGLDLLACTFADNTSQHGPALSLGIPLRAVNCIFAAKAGSGGAVAPQIQGDDLSLNWCSVDVDSAKVFAGGGAPVTQMVAGVTHVVHPPLGGAATGNEDAAEIYHDASYKNVRAVGDDGRRVTLAGNPDQAKIPFILDQLQTVRTAPTRGAVRLAVGTQPVTVELDGVLCDEEGRPRPYAAVATPAIVTYDSGEVAMTDLAIHTASNGVFGLSVPVDGSDGLSHNVTGIQVDALGPEPIAVATAPYALTAASVDLIASDDYIPLAGDGIAIGNLAAASISASQSFDARSAESFTAGELKGFNEIDLEHVAVTGGSLEWLGGDKPAKGVEFANLSQTSVGGGVVAFSGTVSVPYSTQTNTWQAAGDGFMQLRLIGPSAAAIGYVNVEVNVLNSNGSTAFEVTKRGDFGGADRRLLWTIPVRKGQQVELKLDEDEKEKPDCEIPVHAQFIYFGVPE